MKLFVRFFLLVSLSATLPFQQPQAAPTEQEQAAQLFQAGKEEQALRILKRLHERENTYNTGYNYAYYLNLSGQQSDAIALFRSLIAQAPSRYEADIELATIYIAQEKPKQALSLLEKALERGGNTDLGILSKYASLLLQQGDPATAKEALKDFQPTLQQQIQYLSLWGAINFELKNYEETKQSYEKRVQLQPEIVDFQYSLASIYRQTGEYAAAARIYEQQKKASPTNGKAWLEHALLLSLMDQPDSALTEIQEAKRRYRLQDDVKNLAVAETVHNEILIQQGRAILQNQNGNQACSALNQLYQQNQQKGLGLQAAYCFAATDQLQAANSIYSRLIDQNPAAVDVHLEYYDALRRAKRMTEAKELLERYVIRNGYGNPQIVARLASSYIAEKNYKEALQSVYVGQSPEEETQLSFLFLSGLCENALRDPARALQYFKKAQAIAPELITDPELLLQKIDKKENIDYSGIVLFETYNQQGLSATIVINRASFYLVIQNWDKAIEDTQNVLDDPQLPEGSSLRTTAKAIQLEAQIGAAAEKYQQGKMTESLSLFEAIYQADPSSRNALNYAYYSSATNQSARAETILREQLETEPENREATLMMAEILLAESRAAEAQTYLPSQIGTAHEYDQRLSPLLLKALYLQGRLSDLEETLSAIRSAQGRLPLSLLSYEAALYTELGEHEKALQVWQNIAAQKPSIAAPQLEAISSLLKLERKEEAEFLYQEVLLNHKKNPTVWLQRTRFLLGKNRKADARAAAQKARELLEKERDGFWENIDRLLLLGQLQATIGEQKEAERTFLTVLERVPHHFQAHNQLAYLYLDKGDIHGARALFLKTAELQPQNPTISSTLASLYMRALKPGKALYWERKAIPSAQETHRGVEQLRTNSLGVFGYRPVSNIGTKFGFSRFTTRSSAMMLARESLFSDQPLVGFQIDQLIFNGKLGYFLPHSPSLWLNYSNIQNSNSLETSLHLIEPELQGSIAFSRGLLTINPKASILFEQFKNSPESTTYAIASLGTRWQSARTGWSFGNQTVYGSQRVDNFQVPGTFFLTTGGAYWKKGTLSIAEELSYRQDKTSDGLEFTTVITGTSFRQQLGSALLFSTYIKTESLSIGEDDSIFGVEPLITIQTPFFDPRAQPYISINPSFSFQAENTTTVHQYEWGLRYQSSGSLPTRAGGSWLSYKIPYQFTVALQQASYPDLSVESSQTLLFRFQAI